MSTESHRRGPHRKLIQALRGELRHVPDQAHVMVRAFVEDHRLIMLRNPLLQRAVDTADAQAVAAVRQRARVHGIPMSLHLIQDVLGAHHSSVDRKSAGVVYTPGYIVDAICQRVAELRARLAQQPSDPTKWTVLDPAVGSGAFLVGMAAELHALSGNSPARIIESQLYGLDVSEKAAAETELMLSLWALIEGDDTSGDTANIRVGTALEGARLHHDFGLTSAFDAVIGNPPYVRIQNVEPSVRRQIRETWHSASFGNIDLFMPFIEMGLHELADDGVLGYIVPSTFTTTNAGRPLREILLQRQSIVEMIDFDHHQVFEGVTTYAALLYLSKHRRSHFRYAKATNAREIPSPDSLGTVAYARLNPRRWQLISDEMYPTIQAIESAGTRLSDLARIGVGIATLADACYLLTGERDEATGGYVKQVGRARFLIEPEITCPIIKAGRLKSEEGLRANTQRIVFPYRLVKGKRAIVPESRLRRQCPNAYEYLCAVRGRLELRDRGKPNPIAWYAFGRSQGVDSNFGRKLLTPALSLLSNFVLCDDSNVTFYGGYCIQTEAEDLRVLEKVLNSPILDYYLHCTGRSYRYGYKSFARAFLQRFGIPHFSEADRAQIKAADNTDELTELLLERYRLDANRHADLAAFIEKSPKRNAPLPVYANDERDSSPPERPSPEPTLF